MDIILTRIWIKYCRKGIFWFFYFMLYVLVALMAFVGYESFGPVRNPIVVKSASAIAVRKIETVEVSFIRSYKFLFDSEGTVYKWIEHKEFETKIDLPSSYRFQENGEVIRHFSHLLPSNIPNGRYILKTIYLYRPTFSLIERKIEYPDIEFSICGKFESCT
jgi:hypothetical protein